MTAITIPVPAFVATAPARLRDACRRVLDRRSPPDPPPEPYRTDVVAWVDWQCRHRGWFAAMGAVLPTLAERCAARDALLRDLNKRITALEAKR